MMGMGSLCSTGGLLGGDDGGFGTDLFREKAGGGPIPMPMCIPIPPLILAILSRIAIRRATSGSSSGASGSSSTSLFDKLSTSSISIVVLVRLSSGTSSFSSISSNVSFGTDSNCGSKVSMVMGSVTCSGAEYLRAPSDPYVSARRGRGAGGLIE